MNPRRRRTHDRPRRRDLDRPPCVDQRLRLARSRPADDDRGRLLVEGAQQQHLSCVGYGARGSSYRSSPSSQMATSPSCWTGAKAAARVPTTIGTRPGSRPGRRGSGPPGRGRQSTSRGTRRRARPSARRRGGRRRERPGTHSRLPRPEAAVAALQPPAGGQVDARGGASTVPRSPARGEPPRRPALRSPGPTPAPGRPRCERQRRRARAAPASTRACRGGTASRSTSARVPA